MDDKNLELLEFHRVREIIAGYTSFPASRKLALDLACSTDFERITQLLKQSAEARGLLSKEREFSIGEIVDSRNDVQMAARRCQSQFEENLIRQAVHCNGC